MAGDLASVEINVNVYGCCNGSEECEPSDGVSRSRTCNFGIEDLSSTVDCEGDCYTLIDVAAKDVYHGCLNDLDLTDTTFADVTTCSDTYEKGSCADVTDSDGTREMCLRCCTTDKCNDWDNKDDLLAEDGAEALLPSLLLLVVSAILTKINID